MHLGISLYAAGETEEAYERLRQSLELDDRNWIAHLNHTHWLINEDRIAEASRAAERTLTLAPFSLAAVATMAAVLALNGDAGRSAGLIQQLGSPETFAVPSALTAYYLLLQDFEKAAVWAEKAIEQRDVVIPFVLQLRISRGLRSSEYWPKLAKLMNLPLTA
jgi:tetratricopeptide (TPR) repeat protein